jgi:hypothetical protein
VKFSVQLETLNTVCVTPMGIHDELRQLAHLTWVRGKTSVHDSIQSTIVLALVWFSSLHLVAGSIYGCLASIYRVHHGRTVEPLGYQSGKQIVAFWVLTDSDHSDPIWYATRLRFVVGTLPVILFPPLVIYPSPFLHDLKVVTLPVRNLRLRFSLYRFP